MKIFLSQSYEVGYRASRIIFVVVGLSFLSTELLSFFRDGTLFNAFYSGGYSILGTGLFIYALIFLSPKSKYAPRYEFNEHTILIKKSVFSKSNSVDLTTIKAIQ